MSVSIDVLRPSWLTRLRAVDLLSAAAALNPDAHSVWPSTRVALASRADGTSRTDGRDER